MALAVQMYVDEIRRKKALMPGGRFLIEQQLYAKWIDPNLFGTGDHIAIDPLVKVCINDYKHGAGVSVDVIDNPQLMIYGLMAIGEGNPYMVEEVDMTIVQPRAPHADGSVRTFTMDVDDLIAWGNDVLIPGIAKTKSPDLEFNAGDWCRWCPALKAMDLDGKELCPAVKAQRKDMINIMFGKDTVNITPATELKPNLYLSGDDLDWILQRADTFVAGIEAFKTEAFNRLEAGSKEAPKQFKLVKGKSSRTWKDEAAVAKAVKSAPIQAYTESNLKSPAQMENAYKVAKLDVTELGKFIIKKPGRPRMVPLSAAGASVPPKLGRMFAPDVDPFDEDIDPFS